MKFFMLVSVFLVLFMYLGMDPMKGGFYLVLTLVFVAPLLSMGVHSWYAYYICLLFLSGVFVIVVYFASMSKFVYMSSPWGLFLFFLVILVGVDLYSVYVSGMSLNNFYYDVYWSSFLLVIFSLLGLMLFTSYFLSFGVAIRKM